MSLEPSPGERTPRETRFAGAVPARDGMPPPGFFVRGGIGGVLMGLANLVPGISGGTMLLAAGVYPDFITSIADLSTLRVRVRPLAVIATIAGAAALAILMLAGLMRDLVVEQRWIMYSLFIGLTLGGVPLVWRLARPATPGLAAGAVLAFLAMLAMTFGGDPSGSGDANFFLLLLAGLAGASAMILPGVSGGYLLLLLGQYEPILGAIDTLKQGLLGAAGFDLALVLEAARVVVPVGIGVVVGVVGVSNLLKWLLQRYEKATLGVLLGLLFGAVVGLWPFQQPVEPQPGDTIKGRTVRVETMAEIDREDWALQRFTPSGGEVASSLALVAFGLGVTLAIARFGDDDAGAADPSDAGVR